MYLGKRFFERKPKYSSSFPHFSCPYHKGFLSIRQEKKAAADFCRSRCLLLPERLAVSALIHRGICLVSTHQDLVQGAVVLVLTVVGAGLDGAFDALVCMAIHIEFLLLIWYVNSMTSNAKATHGNPFLLIAFEDFPWYHEKNTF